MKKESISAMFGFTQADMAMLLGIGTSHWSMYESGLRDLPLHAKTLLAEMLAHMKQSKLSDNEKRVPDAAAIARHGQRIKNKLDENWLQLYRLDQKLSALQKKKASAIRRAHLCEFLKATPHEKMAFESLPLLLVKSSRTDSADHDLEIENYLFERDCLLMEKKMLESMFKSVDKG